MNVSFLAIFLILLSQQPTGIIADCEGMPDTFRDNFILPKTADNGEFVKNGARFKTGPGKCLVCNTTEWSDGQSNGAMLDDYCKPCQDSPSTSIEVETTTRQTKNCGKRKPEFKPHGLISRGTSVEDIAKWPWLVALELEYLRILRNGKREGFKGTCTGSIIDRHFVLTAAHCAIQIVGIDLSADKYASSTMVSTTIYAGRSNFMDEKAQKRVVLPENVIVHEKYIIQKYELHMDMALIKLSQPFDFNDRVLPICLNSSSHEVRAGSMVHIAGWGRIEEDDIEGVQIEGKMPPVLHEATAKILSMEDCLEYVKMKLVQKNPDKPVEKIEKYMRIQREIYKHRICTLGLNESNIQTGDSGGALIYFDTEQGGHWSNIGVVSYGILRENKEAARFPAFFTKIDADACRWISEKTGGIVGCGK